MRQFLLAFILLLSFTGKASADSIPQKKRLAIVIAGGGALYTGSMVGLYNLWYKNYPQTHFHFINDNSEWLQLDKAGHAFTSYYEGVYGYRMMRWAGLPEKKAAWYGGAFGFLLQTPIEILDGFSAHWGASAGDLAANTAGSALFIAQQLAWQEQKVQLKFSFTPSPSAKKNPALLGSTYPEQFIKDYNAQTYWLSAGLQEMTGIKKIPRWLNLALGYGGDGLMRGTALDQAADPVFHSFQRSRQYYLSFDINMLELHPKNIWLRRLCTAAACLKTPSPAIEYNERGALRFHFLYF